MLHGHEWCVDQRKDKERWRGGEHSREEVCWLLVGSRPRPRLSAPPSTSTVLPQYFYSTDEQSGALANLSPNDQRHITTPTRSSSPPRFGKCQTGSPSVFPASHSKPWTQIDFESSTPSSPELSSSIFHTLWVCVWVWDWWNPSKSPLFPEVWWPALGSVGCLFGSDHAKKNSKPPYFWLFQHPNTFCPYWLILT